MQTQTKPMIKLKFITRRAKNPLELTPEYHFSSLQRSRCINYLATGEEMKDTPREKCVWYAVFYAENILYDSIQLALRDKNVEAAKEIAEVWDKLRRLYSEYLEATTRGLESLARERVREIAKTLEELEIDPW